MLKSRYFLLSFYFVNVISEKSAICSVTTLLCTLVLDWDSSNHEPKLNFTHFKDFLENFCKFLSVMLKL